MDKALFHDGLYEDRRQILCAMRFAVRDLHTRIQRQRADGFFPDALQADYKLYRLMDGVSP